MSERVGVYPGTFDPITNGHTDIILRATKIVDRLVIGVARNAGKGPLFTTDERVAIVRDEIAHLADAETHKRIEVAPFDNAADAFRGRRWAPRSSSAACAPSRISNTSSRWPA